MTRGPAPTSAQEQLVVETPADRVISNGLRATLLSQQGLRSDLQNVQITTNNGVVTFSGSVPSRDARDAIITTAQDFSGVRQVIDHLQIR